MAMVLNAIGDVTGSYTGSAGRYVDLHVGGHQRLAILVRQQHDRLGDVTDDALRQARLIVVDQRDDVPARNVAMVDDRESGGVEVQADVDECRRRESSSGWCGRAADWETSDRRRSARRRRPCRRLPCEGRCGRRPYADARASRPIMLFFSGRRAITATTAASSALAIVAPSM